MRYVLALLASVSAVPAAAQTTDLPTVELPAPEELIDDGVKLPAPPKTPTTVTVYSSILTQYGFQDLGVVFYDKPVIQSGVTVSRGRCSVDLWNSSGLTTKGTYGNRGYSDEFDLTLACSTSIGKVTVTGSLSYYAVAPLAQTRDDMVQVFIQAETTFDLGQVSVTPYARIQQWWGTPDFPKDTFVRAGARATVPIAGPVSASGDLSDIVELDRNRHVLRGDVSLSYDFGNRLSGSLSAKFARGMDTIFAVGVSKTF